MADYTPEEKLILAKQMLGIERMAKGRLVSFIKHILERLDNERDGWLISEIRYFLNKENLQ